jgi:hypothetical protein
MKYDLREMSTQPTQCRIPEDFYLKKKKKEVLSSCNGMMVQNYKYARFSDITNICLFLCMSIWQNCFLNAGHSLSTIGINL